MEGDFIFQRHLLISYRHLVFDTEIFIENIQFQLSFMGGYFLEIWPSLEITY